VADNGPGVSPANREKIFEPDFSTRHSLKKLGFGLWWVKSLVQRFGGSIALAESAAPECVFIIRLPPVEQGKDL
jgi:signal transduction histidine kinase